MSRSSVPFVLITCQSTVVLVIHVY
jgi:hypothetical protein